MRCRNCGQELAEGTRMCPICKTVQDTASVQAQKSMTGETEIHNDTSKVIEIQEYKNTNSQYAYKPRSRVVAGLLQIFLGGFGMGRFYLGYNGIALGQLFTMPVFFIGMIWGFVDGILILCGQVQYDANGIPLK